MKRALAILLSLAAAAHAQFAVMHTNGVVTSPTNFTIQQSNVAGLTNALAGKLGTNPTLAISNTMGLQSALDSKLATNGSATGLTGFVGTTNAETARGNLGISNTFAGQFHADYYDDFSRYTNGTQFTNGRSPLIGSNYVLRDGTTNQTPPSVTNGTLTQLENKVFYLSSELPRPVYNFGAEWTWESGKTNSGTWAVFIVRPDDTWLDRLLHIVVTPNAANIDVSTGGGVANFVTISSNSFGNVPLVAGVRQTLSGEIEGNTARLNVGGKRIEVTDSRISQVTGRFFTFETFSGQSTNFANLYWHKAWANSPSMSANSAQPFSESLYEFANGDAGVLRYLTVGTNKATYYGDLSPAIPVWIDGGIRVKGRILGWTGGGFAEPPLVVSRGTGDASLYNIGNTNTTNLVYQWADYVGPSFFSNNWNRWVVTAVGSLSATTNNKRVVFEAAGGLQLDTGNITNSGEWLINAIVYKTPTNTHEVYAVFEMDNYRKSSRFTLSNNTTIGFSIRGAATSNNEVILRGAWADWYP